MGIEQARKSRSVTYRVRQTKWVINVTTLGSLLSYHGLDLLVDPFPVGVEGVCKLGPDYVPIARHDFVDNEAQSCRLVESWDGKETSDDCTDDCTAWSARPKYGVYHRGQC